MSFLRVRAAALGVIGIGAMAGMLCADPPADDPRVRAVAAIVELSQHLDDQDVSDRAKKIVADHDSCDISTIFRPKKFGGLGIGRLATSENRNSVERLVETLTKNKALTEQHLDEFQPDYLRVAKVLQAMAEMAPHRGTIVFGSRYGKKAEAWTEVSAEFKKTSAGFRRAIEEKDPKKVRLAAEAVQQSCVNCHNVRDS